MLSFEPASAASPNGSEVCFSEDDRFVRDGGMSQGGAPLFRRGKGSHWAHWPSFIVDSFASLLLGLFGRGGFACCFLLSPIASRGTTTTVWDV